MQQVSHYYIDSEGAIRPQAWGTPPGTTALFESDVYAIPPAAGENGILPLLAFSWPVIAIAFWQWRKQAVGIVPRILEVVLLAGTFILVLVISTFTLLTVTRVGAGGHLAFLGLGFYAVGALWADVIAFRGWVRPADAPAAGSEEEKMSVAGSTAIMLRETGKS
jgi:hypothetical protein